MTVIILEEIVIVFKLINQLNLNIDKIEIALPNGITLLVE